MSDLFTNFNEYLKFWTTLAMIVVSILVQQGCIAPDSIDEKQVSGFLFAIAPVIALLVPNRKRLSSGETVNVAKIDEIVDEKVAEEAAKKP